LTIVLSVRRFIAPEFPLGIVLHHIRDELHIVKTGTRSISLFLGGFVIE